MTQRMDADEGASACMEVARLRDPDRFFCAMFLPPSCRAEAFVLIAFNYELSRALVLPTSSETSGPMAGLIRLQWWRDIILAPERARQARHDVAIALTELVGSGRVEQDVLLRMIDARENELCGLEDWEAWRAAQSAGPGGLHRLMAALLPIRDDETLDAVAQVGAAFAVGTLLRHLPLVLASGRMPLPRSAMTEVGLASEGRPGELPDERVLAALAGRLREEGTGFLEAGRMVRPSRAERLAFLPAVLARRDLRRGLVLSPGNARPLSDRLAVVWAGLRARS